MNDEAALSAAMARLGPHGIRIGCRPIRADDESLLLPEEARAISARNPAARRASGAARAVARSLLLAEGFAGAVIGRDEAGVPLWPAGIVGSLAHDDAMAVAAIAHAADHRSLGIDVEPAEPLPEDIAALVTLPQDVIAGIDPHLAARLMFSAKEAAYKAVFPLDREVLGYEHIAVDLPRGAAVTATGRSAAIWFCLSPRIVVLAAAG